MIRPRTAARLATRAVTIALAGQAAVNARLLRRPPAAAPPSQAERISVLLPARDEAHQIGACLSALARQRLPAGMQAQIFVLDDASRDDTAGLVEAFAARHSEFRLIRGAGDPPKGFIGKPWACARLAATAPRSSTVLIFVDADVVLEPDGLARTVALLRSAELSFVSPYPRQIAVTMAERLVQPLLQWSWLTLAPLRLAERTRRPSLVMANGQLLAVDAAAYAQAGGHAAPAVRGQVLEDIALARALRSQGHRGGMADGTELASCRMYNGFRQLRDGYSKSLWAAAGGSPIASAAQLALLGVLYLRPDPVTYAAGVASRVVAARRTGGRVLPDALAHPLSIAALSALTVLSWFRRATGGLRWKGRPVTAGAWRG